LTISPPKCDSAGEVVRRSRTGGAGVVIDWHIQFFAHRPQRIVDLGVQGLQMTIGRYSGHQDAAKEVVLLGPFDLGHGIVDVVEEHLGHSGSSSWSVSAEVGEPPVMGPETSPTLLVLRRLGSAGQ
jgi:hypothetical protein